MSKLSCYTHEAIKMSQYIHSTLHTYEVRYEFVFFFKHEYENEYYNNLLWVTFALV